MASVFEIDSAAAAGPYVTVPSRQSRWDQDGVETVPIGMLLPSDSPRLAGENSEHARALAESESTFPPIIVNRSTLRVIDGMHRLNATALRGQDDIGVQFFDGDERDSFVLAVEANIVHGLPLSLADRAAAAARIIDSHPEWSDRMIASKAGLAARSVGAIRRRSTEDSPQLNVRIGRDGRIRPLNTVQGRRIASELMKDSPDAPLREIAGMAGISLGTAQDVRQRLRRGEDPLLPKQRDGQQRKGRSRHDELANRRDSGSAGKPSTKDRTSLLNNLRRDPALRFADAGRNLLRLLHVLAIDPREWEHLIENVPGHCRPVVSDAAHACADMWREFAEQLERR